MYGYGNNFATPKQLAFIASLAKERLLPAGINLQPTRKQEASNVISELLRAPKKTAALDPRPVAVPVVREQLVPGVYETDGTVYVVKYNREKTNLYAKRMVEVGNGVQRATESGETVKGVEFEYAPGAVFNIRLADRMPLERAKELITLYGTCIACGRHLKAAKSVEQGIGPVCIKNFGPVLQEVEAVTVDGRNTIVTAA